MGVETFQVIRILTLSAFAFALAMALTPLWTSILYRYRLGKQIRTEGTPIFATMHKKKEGTPTMGGVLIWGTAIVVLALLALLRAVAPETFWNDFYFLSRAETLLPLGALVMAALIGLADDLLGILRLGPKGGGLSMKQRLLVYLAIAAVGAWWFYFKLEWDVLAVPFLGMVTIGAWYIPFFILVITATMHSVNLTDGLDGLSGGVLLIAFASYGLIAFVLGRFDLAVLCGVIAGALVAFLWFNVHPARFFMGDTGAMALGVTLGVIAMLTNAALILPLIAFIPVIESGSVIVQVTSKRLRGKKVFHSTPIHHHFEAKGWPETKVTERFWIISGVMATIGLLIYLLGT
jgi:phospho-N-acetylmuramoyl-pentapeptide-transferase